jgi:preprotein translocase subunit SecG
LFSILILILILVLILILISRTSSDGFLPIRSDEVARWVLEEDTSDIRDWMRRVRAWVRAEVMGRPR